MGAKKPLAGLGVGLGVCAVALMVMAYQLVTQTTALLGLSWGCEEGQLTPSGVTEQAGVTNLAEDEVPGDMLELYRDAAEAWEMDWALLAAVGWKESRHGSDPRTETENHAGALGPMQFTPPAWEHHGRFWGDTTGEEGTPALEERRDARTAVWSAAHKLADQGANTDPEGALVAYYGADTDGYVSTAMAKADQYRDGDFSPAGGGEVVLASQDCPEGSGTPGQAPDYDVGDLSGQAQLAPCPIDNEPFATGAITPLTCAAHRTIVANFRDHLVHSGNCKRDVDDGGEHFKGRACDYMTSPIGVHSTGNDEQVGIQITEFVMNNHAQLGVKYIIWYQSIWHPDRSSCDGPPTYSANVPNLSHGIWCGMGDRGSVTENHYDHVHVSFIE